MTSTVVIIASPREGNSKTIALAMAEGAKENGNTVKTYYLNKLKNVKGCQSCYGCKKTGRCVVKDDQTEILQALRDADSIILSTPNYFGQAVAQYKLLEDRFFSFLNGDFSPNIAPNKKIAIAVTCGSGYDIAENIAKSIENVWVNSFKGICVGKVIMKDGMSPDTAAKDSSLIAEARAIGRKL